MGLSRDFLGTLRQLVSDDGLWGIRTELPMEGPDQSDKMAL